MDSIIVDFDIVDAVNDSWRTIKKIPNYEQVAGEILFRKIFELAPAALGMYPFGAEFKGREDELYQSPVFQKHAKGVVQMLDEAVNMLGPDLEPVTKALTQLGARHIAYGVVPAHYPIVGEALVHTLKTALGKKWTKHVAEGWTAIYGFVSTAMIAGATRQLEKAEKRREKIRRRIQKIQETTVSSPTSSSSKKKEQRQQRKASTAKDVIATVPGLKKTRSCNKKSLCKDKDQVLSVIDDVLDVSNHIKGSSSNDLTEASSISSSSASTDCADPTDCEEENYHLVIDSVYRSWDKIKAIPDYEKVAGVLLFRKIFEIAPAAKGLYSFYKADDPTMQEEAFYEHPAFIRHAVGVVRMLDAAVNMLGPDLDLVSSVLEGLGARHVAYGVIPDHYPIVGQALLSTLEAALGPDGWTENVKLGWTTIFSFVSSTMIKGATEAAAETEAKQQQSNKKGGKGSPSVSSSNKKNLVAFQV